MTLNGIITPSMIPLELDDAINEDELRRYFDWLIERGVYGLYPNGSTGEFTRFTAEERRSIIRIVCDQAGDRVPVLAGAAKANTREMLRACEAHLGYGARAVASRSRELWGKYRTPRGWLQANRFEGYRDHHNSTRSRINPLLKHPDIRNAQAKQLRSQCLECFDPIGLQHQGL